MEPKFCQSCGMPLASDSPLFGTEADGSPSSDYCTYCYQNGKFTADVTMEQMIDFCVPHVTAAHPEMTAEAAREMMVRFFPQLKRWNRGMPQADLKAKAVDMLDKCAVLSLSSVSEDGYPRGCVMCRVASEGLNKIYISTGTSSRKTAHFRVNPKAGICFYEGTDSVTLLGNIRILGDDERGRYWQDWMSAHFVLGVSDPDFCVLEFNTTEATVWIENNFQTFSV